MMTVADILIQFAIVISASLIGSFIFSAVFLKVLKRTFVSSASKLISHETKQRTAEWLQEVVKNGISESLKDPKVKTVTLEIMDLIKEKLIKEEEEEGKKGGSNIK